MTPSPIELAEIVSLIWSTQLGFDPEPSTAGQKNGLEEREDGMTGVVQISGEFTGALHLSCASELVVAAGAKMFGRPEVEINKDDLRDVLGELTNMTAGNLKSRLPGPSTISLPTVVDGTNYEVTRLDSEVVATTHLICKGHPMTATLFINRQ